MKSASYCVAAVAALLLAACGSEPTGAAGSGAPASGSAAKSAAKPANSAPASASAAQAPDEKRGKMSNCPAAVEKAKTEIKDVDKGVEVTVTAADKAGTDEIRARSKSVTEHAKADAAKGQHNGAGGSGGSMGRCPIVIGGTDITAVDVEGGAKYTVLSKDAKELDWLRRESKERLAAMGTAEKGDRKMANCPSAVTGAKTSVKEAAGAVVITVLAKDAKDEASVKDIRDRAKKNVELKHDGSDKEKHDGDGGGAGDGRCPSVHEGATVTAKDVDGGSEITVKPKAAADLKKTATEATDRAKRFD
jgi:TusA-related sulfurtransferase